MRRIVTALAATVSAVVLMFSYHTSTAARVAVAARSSALAPVAAGGSASTSGSATGGSVGGSVGGSATTTTTSAARTYTGSTVQTPWGPVQVRVTVAGGRVTAADAVVVPSGNPRDDQINGYAVPVLNAEVVQAQSARIDAVSGATVTSGGYQTSLQSALDAAHLG